MTLPRTHTLCAVHERSVGRAVTRAPSVTKDRKSTDQYEGRSCPPPPPRIHLALPPKTSIKTSKLNVICYVLDEYHNISSIIISSSWYVRTIFCMMPTVDGQSYTCMLRALPSLPASCLASSLSLPCLPAFPCPDCTGTWNVIPPISRRSIVNYTA